MTESAELWSTLAMAMVRQDRGKDLRDYENLAKI